MPPESPGDDWFDDYAEGADDLQIDEYDITATPNDFNVVTLNNFVESGAVKIPGFQRNFVWDIARSSKLIESLILGLPVPQLFLYEQSRNNFLVIDGQQRLMTIYYFMHGRFPRRDKRPELREIYAANSKIPDAVFYDDAFFESFNLRIPGQLPDHKNRFRGLNYSTLGDYRTQFDLRPIRNIVVKQNSPSDDDSSMYEIFNRLNTGGVNLSPQEIRTSMYHSDFYEMLYRINRTARWRTLLGRAELDLHMKDVEILLRAFAMLVDGPNYSPSMVRFLNRFSKRSHDNTDEQNKYLETLFGAFIDSCSNLPPDAFVNKRNRRFNLALFEAVFAAVNARAFRDREVVQGTIEAERVRALEQDEQFLEASIEGTTRTSNVTTRLARALEKVGSL